MAIARIISREKVNTYFCILKYSSIALFYVILHFSNMARNHWDETWSFRGPHELKFHGMF